MHVALVTLLLTLNRYLLGITPYIFQRARRTSFKTYKINILIFNLCYTTMSCKFSCFAQAFIDAIPSMMQPFCKNS